MGLVTLGLLLITRRVIGTAMTETDHEKDRAFLAWLKAEATLAADLRAKWHELYERRLDLWKLRAIERELVARGEELPF